MRRPLTEPKFWIFCIVVLVLGNGYEHFKAQAMRNGWWSVIFIEAVFGPQIDIVTGTGQEWSHFQSTYNRQ
jgi:hypothetical protein